MKIITVTIPDDIVEALDKRAESEFRSRSSQVAAMLRDGLGLRTPGEQVRESLTAINNQMAQPGN